jgi:flagellin-like hook-associated protein FlgL
MKGFTRPRMITLTACVIAFLLSASPSFADGIQGLSSLDYLNRVLVSAEGEYAKSSQRLSGGLTLLTDDPASRAIFDMMAAQVRALGMNIRNGADMLSFYQFQEAAISSQIDLLQRVRELLVARSNGILSDDDRESLDSEIAGLYEEILDGFKRAEFNGIKVFSAQDLKLSSQFLSQPRFYDLKSVDAALQALIHSRAQVGALSSAQKFTSSGQETQRLNAASAQSQGDTDVAKEVIKLQQSYILMMANTLMLR